MASTVLSFRPPSGRASCRWRASRARRPSHYPRGGPHRDRLSHPPEHAGACLAPADPHGTTRVGCRGAHWRPGSDIKQIEQQQARAAVVGVGSRIAYNIIRIRRRCSRGCSCAVRPQYQSRVFVRYLQRLGALDGLSTRSTNWFAAQHRQPPKPKSNLT